MIFSKHLQDTKFSPLTLLDFAYVVVLLPLIVMLKIPMIIFLFVVVVLIYIKRTPAKNLLVLSIFLLGTVTIYLSLYGAFSFRGLSRLKLFLELLVYILLVVVAMQRLTRNINFYLIISPFLFLALSLFFYHGMVMLIYVIFEVFFLLWMILSHRMGGNIKEGFRSSVIMFMYSLPWVVILFIFFPRISFEHASYGFKGETVQRMGHDGTMYLDNQALLVPSERIVMEVGFDGSIPPQNTLYFRGSILYVDKKDHWEEMPPYIKREPKPYYPTSGTPISYKVTLYPTQKKWLYTLDMPAKPIENSTLDRDLISTLKDEIKEPVHYAATSSLSPMFHDLLDKATLRASSTFDKRQNPRTYKAAQEIKQSYKNKAQRADALLNFFKSQSLTYTLKPEALDLNHTTDSFLFDTRRGYCVHFASSFVTLSRMAGIPARIVTGYKANVLNGLNNYLPVKEEDAHAWAELYLDEHWMRVETTSTASKIESTPQSIKESNTNNLTSHPTYQKINLYLMYAKYQVETWILYYSHIRQLQLLDYLKNHPTFLLIFVLSLIALLILSFIIIAYFKRPQYKNEAMAILSPLIKKLKKEGFIRSKEETLHHYFIRYVSQNPDKKNILKIDNLYENMIYNDTKNKKSLKALKKEVKTFMR